MLTRGQIITEGLSRAGRSDLVSDARLWLNLFLEKVYMNQDFKWLEKSVSGLALSQNYDLFDDYRAIIAISLGTNRSPLTQVFTADEWDYVKGGNSNASTPTHFFINEIDDVIEFYPAPASGLTFNASYYRMPSLPDHEDPNSDDESPFWKLPTEILIEAIKMYAMDYNDDVRFDAQEQRLFAKIAEARLNAQDNRASHGRFKLGKSFKKRF